MSDLVRVSVSLEKALADKLDALVADSQYTNRSEFVRDLVRGRLVERQWKAGQPAIGTITLLYDHHVRGLGERLTHQQHHFAGKVLATTHIHLDEHLCSEMIMVRGKAAQIEDLANRLGREKGVLHAALSIGAIGKDLR